MNRLMNRKYTLANVASAVNQKLDELAPESWDASRIAREIAMTLASRLTGDPDAIDAAHFCLYTVHRRSATECIGARDVDNAAHVRNEPEQLVLNGFKSEYLQAYYVVDDIAVAIGDMTDEQIDARVALYREQSKTLAAHAHELVRYKLWRKRPTPPGSGAYVSA